MPHDDTSDLPDGFYLPTGETEFESTSATTSPWDDTMQHGGPPAALLARAVEQVRADDDMSIARLTIDMLGPIPQGHIVTEAQILRPGKRIELVEAKLWAEGRLAVTATAWRLRHTPDATAEHAHSVTPSPIPEPQEQRYFPGVSPTWGYGRAVEWRFVEGSYDVAGPANVWARPRIPLVAGEETTPVQRLAIIADSANGLSAELPQDEWAFIPPTMTLTLGRVPISEWVNIDARTVVATDGRGVTEGDLYDQDGYVGAVSQPLLVSAR